MQGQAQHQLQLVVAVQILIRGLLAAASKARLEGQLQAVVLQLAARASVAVVSPTTTTAASVPPLPLLLGLRLLRCSESPLLLRHCRHRHPPQHHLARRRLMTSALGHRQLRRLPLPLLHLRPRRQLRRHDLLRRLRLHLVQHLHRPVRLWVPRQLQGGGAQPRRQHQQQAIHSALRRQPQQLQQHQYLAQVAAARPAVLEADLTALEVLSAALAAPAAAVAAVIHSEDQRLRLLLQRHEGLRLLRISLAVAASAARPLAVARATHSEAVAAAA